MFNALLDIIKVSLIVFVCAVLSPTIVVHAISVSGNGYTVNQNVTPINSLMAGAGYSLMGAGQPVSGATSGGGYYNNAALPSFGGTATAAPTPTPSNGGGVGFVGPGPLTSPTPTPPANPTNTPIPGVSPTPTINPQNPTSPTNPNTPPNQNPNFSGSNTGASHTGNGASYGNSAPGTTGNIGETASMDWMNGAAPMINGNINSSNSTTGNMKNTGTVTSPEPSSRADGSMYSQGDHTASCGIFCGCSAIYRLLLLLLAVFALVASTVRRCTRASSPLVRLVTGSIIGIGSTLSVLNCLHLITVIATIISVIGVLINTRLMDKRGRAKKKK